MELTPEQRAVVEHAGAARLVVGGFASGKTTALVARWRRLAEAHGSGKVLYIAAHAAAAADVQRRMIATGITSGPLVVSTWTGIALDVVRRHATDLAEAPLVAGHARRAAIAAALTPARAVEWPASASVAKRAAFAHAVEGGLDALVSAELPVEEVLARADGVGCRARWEELVAFGDRLATESRAAGRIDLGSLMHIATGLVDAAAESARFVEVIVDDADAMAHAERRLLAALGLPATLAAHGDSALAASFGDEVIALADAAPAAQHLVWCRHPSIEADAIVGELVAAHDEGAGWNDVAVIVPRRGLPIARAVVRALQRHEIPVHVSLADGDAEPVVRALRAALAERDKADDALAASEQLVADAVRGLADEADLDAPEPSVHRALDALVAFQRGVRRWAQTASDCSVAGLCTALEDGDISLWSAGADADGVAVVTPEEAAGRHWAAAVVAGCVEGEYPRVTGDGAWFDAALTRDVPIDTAGRRAAQIAAQRRRFGVASTRAPQVVFVTAPQPGVLVSRYVEHLAATDARPAWRDPKAYEHRPATIATTPIHPGGQLHLSASQLSTYEDCPRRWFYDSALRLQDSTSVWADFGTLVHDILQEFLSPQSTVEYSLDGLLDLGESMWTDDIAQFAPQREQARREVREVLANWWTMEGEHLERDNVIAVEAEFNVAVGDHVVRGRIDRVDWDADREGLRVIDYKTSRRAKTDDEVAQDIQLEVYFLAARRSESLQQHGEPKRLELLFLRSKKIVEQPIGADHEANAEARILDAAARMLAEDLEPLPTADCDYCDYHRLCPLQRAGREVGVR